MVEQRGTEAQRRLLRQLASGFSVYRLYPGALEVQTFVAAVERIRDAAVTALDTGPVHVRLQAGRFVLDDEPVLDRSLRSLAQACFARRIQHLRIDDPPTSEDLGSLFAALTTDEREIEEAGGVAAVLERDGVTSLRVAVGDAELTAGDEKPDAVIDPPSEARADGAALYAYLSGLSQTLLDDALTLSSFFARAAERVAELPAAERARFGRLVLDELTTDSFAELYAGYLADPNLAEMVTTTALHEGADPVAVAHSVIVDADRHATLLELTATLARSPATGADVSHALPTAEHDQPTMDHLLRAEFPDDEEGARRLARVALHDYLLLEPGTERLAPVIDAITTQLRDDIRAGDAASVHGLLGVLESVATQVPDEVARQLETPGRTALDAEFLQELVVAHDGPIDPRLLAPFGRDGIDAAIDALAATHDQEHHRRAMGRILQGLAHDHLDEIGSRIGRQRPEVVATIVEVLGHDERDEVMPLLDRLAHHPARVVLAAVVEALAHREPTRAAPIVGRVATRSGDRDIALRCLEVLDGYAADAGTEELARLARRHPPPRLPWRLRRRARALARRREAAP